MILRKLKINNFRQVHGSNEVRFASGERGNLTVILGENASGKTTLLNAFVWCLYGRVEMENPTDTLCHRAAEEAAVGDTLAAEVSLIFEHDNHTYVATRHSTYQKSDGREIVPVSLDQLRVDRTDESGETVEIPDPKQQILQLLPEGLCRFFFFRGEDMEALALRTSAGVLKEGVESFLDVFILDRAIKHLEQVRKDFEGELARVAVGDIREITEAIARAEADIVDCGIRVEQAEANRQALLRQLEEVEAELSQFDEVRPFLEEKQAVSANLKSLERARVEKRAEIARLVSRDGYLWFGEECLQRPVELADAAVSRGELPAQIKPGFVDSLLASGTCICGESLDHQHRIHLEDWKGTVGLAELEARINSVRNSAQNLTERRRRFGEDLERHRLDLGSTLEEIRKATERLSQIESKLRGKDFGIEYVKGLQTKRDRIKDDIAEAKVTISRERDKLIEAQAKLDDLRQQRKDKRQASEMEQLAQSRIDAVLAIQAAFEQVRTDWVAAVRHYLDGQLKENWGQIAQLDRLVEFSEEFQLHISEQLNGEWFMSAPSQSYKRALALAFVAALIKLAKDISESVDASKPAETSVFSGGLYPLVMDAPFAHMDEEFKRTIPRNLVSIVPQVIIISSHDQWDGPVEEALKASVGSRYVLELHRPRRFGPSKAVKMLGHDVDYVVAEDEESLDWSVLKEVTQ